MIEVLVVLGLAGLVGYGVYRVRDSREDLPADLDDSLYSKSVRGLWIFVALISIILAGARLLNR